jgi:hypothetical protein
VSWRHLRAQEGGEDASAPSRLSARRGDAWANCVSPVRSLVFDGNPSWLLACWRRNGRGLFRVEDVTHFPDGRLEGEGFLEEFNAGF